MKKYILCFITIILCFSPITYAQDESTAEILESQKESVNISEFIKEADYYTKEVFEDMDINELLESAIKGNINNDTLFKKVLTLLGREIVNCTRVLGSTIIIIIIHSVLKNISEGLENKGVAQITYYVQYILIVSLVLVSFSEIITMVKNSVDNLVGFMNTLVPMLITLMITSRKFCKCWNGRTNIVIFNYIYREFYKWCNNTNFTIIYRTRDNF